jgi:hypothetical protein
VPGIGVVYQLEKLVQVVGSAVRLTFFNRFSPPDLAAQSEKVLLKMKLLDFFCVAGARVEILGSGCRFAVHVKPPSPEPSCSEPLNREVWMEGDRDVSAGSP